ncbi:ribosomal protein S18-alanine N-acetyltransferase [Neomoorella thermoacetica]|uniref:Mycothiol acetyltransferase n=2 Tax=Neomoorella thermoacetica TaxID=1525 RepID=A0A1D7XE47_NEOTH|nr:ribosomal protein S18-alanine N-acetyltransferase [Moorella thermoacetica]AKX94999.1 mycothiol acetyltransferase [Moorella thermoacetica]AKX97626.1 mycothiol acetyltransferase [Moorella thermoacetica]AOQ25141.1 ribosomal-protein-alanine N-acetyltransferase [Moorella thermoacetica]APC09398.1 mycothiol acetyltransferase [Moorella thermoacetica]OIQ09127.1 mycothiol acetyltransferase [Moorella thermoacetica]
MTVQILPMINEYLNGVLAIERVSFPTPWTRHSFQNEIYNNDFAYYYVALDGQKVIGYAGMWIILDEAHITNVAVHPDYRGRRLGEVLLRVLMQEAVYLGADRMTLEVRVSNHSAQRLYERLGFVRAGVRRGYYNDNREDAIIMWKHLFEENGKGIGDRNEYPGHREFL